MRKLPCHISLTTLVVAISCLLASSGAAYAEDVSKIENLILRLQPSVVMIQSVIYPKAARLGNCSKSYNNIKRGWSGTGFIISSDGYIVTNGHVIQPYIDANKWPLPTYMQEFYSDLLTGSFPKQCLEGLTEEDIKKSIRVKSNTALLVKLSTGETFTAEKKAYSPPMSTSPGMDLSLNEGDYATEAGKDVAIIKIEGRNLPIAKLGDSQNIRKGEPLYIFGYPGAVNQHQLLSEMTMLDATVNQGSVSGIKQDKQRVTVLQTDTQITHGNSGGPAFNSLGEVVGMATFGTVSESGQVEQGFNYLVPVNTVKEFVRVAGLPSQTESLFNKVWYEALDLNNEGKTEQALAKCAEALRLLPNQPDVLKLQKALQEDLSNQKKSPAFRPTTALVALAAALLAGAGFVLLRRNKKAGPAEGGAGVTTAGSTLHDPHCGCLVCNEGATPGKTYAIVETGITIGRDPDRNQIVVEREEVSREHAWIGMVDGKLLIKDLGSLNGTYLNSTDGKRIESAPLHSGDVIIIGKGKFASFTYKAQ